MTYRIIVAEHGEAKKGTGPSVCAILLDLVEDKHWREPPAPIDEPDPVFLQHGVDLLKALGRTLLLNGYGLRMDVAESSLLNGHWPRRCRTAQEFEAAVASVLAFAGTGSHDLIYPYAIWAIHSPKLAMLDELIAQFNRDRADLAQFRRIVDSGGLRLSGLRSSLSLNMACEVLVSAREWIRMAASESPTSVVWRT